MQTRTERRDLLRVAVVGGGTAGCACAWGLLMRSRMLERRLGLRLRVTVFEGEDTLGGRCGASSLPGLVDSVAAVNAGPACVSSRLPLVSTYLHASPVSSFPGFFRPVSALDDAAGFWARPMRILPICPRCITSRPYA